MKTENRECIKPDPMTLARIEKEYKILERYQALKAADVTDKMSLMMDLEYSGIDLDKLLEADDKTLLHDVNGIICNMNRKDKKLEGFIPKVGMR